MVFSLDFVWPHGARELCPCSCWLQAYHLPGRIQNRIDVTRIVRFCHHISVAVVLVLLVLDGKPVRAQTVDLELVLAVDASGSVDDREYALQLGGIAQGFRDPEVRRAIRQGSEGRIAVNLLTWAEHQVPKDSTGWHVIAGDSDAERFAQLVEGLPRSQNGGTGLGEGIAAAIRAFAGSSYSSLRQVIDVSGDGKETPAREFVVLLPQARAMANANNVMINGLAILNEDPGLLVYYRDNVRLGPGSFVISASDYTDFAEAMRRKLLREIENRPKLSLMEAVE